MEKEEVYKITEKITRDNEYGYELDISKLASYLSSQESEIKELKKRLEEANNRIDDLDEYISVFVAEKEPTPESSGECERPHQDEGVFHNACGHWTKDLECDKCNPQKTDWKVVQLWKVLADWRVGKVDDSVMFKKLENFASQKEKEVREEIGREFIKFDNHPNSNETIYNFIERITGIKC